jgi:hypothetical protein
VAGNLNAIFNLAGTRLYTLVAYLGFGSAVSGIIDTRADIIRKVVPPCVDLGAANFGMVLRVPDAVTMTRSSLRGRPPMLREAAGGF